MARLNSYTVNISLPTIAQFFHVNIGEVSRIITFYLLVITGTLLLFGRLGDRIGLKKIFIIGYIVFVSGSFLCGLSMNADMLVSSRCIQGLGGSMLLATSFAIISRFIPSDRLGWAFGITSTSSALGVATGAPLGGIITGYLSWHWIFLINVPVGIIAIFMAIRNIPDDSRTRETRLEKKERFDIPGTFLSFAGLITLVYALDISKKMGWGSLQTLTLVAAAVLLLFIFVMWEKRCKAPLLDPGMFRNKGFTFALLATFMAFMLIAGNAFLLPFYLEIVKGLNSAQSGMALLTYSLIYVFLSSSAGRLADKVNPALLCTIAMISAALCAFTFSWTLRLNGLIPVFLFLVWLGLSYVIFFSPNNTQVMKLAPQGSQGVASGLFNTTTNLAMVFGVSLFELTFSSSLPGMAKGAGSLARVPEAMLIKGFHNAYIVGGIICVAGMIFSLLVSRKNSGTIS